MARAYSTNRVRKLLKQEVVPEGKGYVATVEDCERWFGILNEELFENKLTPVQFDFKWLRKCWAYYEYHPRSPERQVSIIIHKKYPSKRLFVECLAHEMVHHWQYINHGYRKVDHGEQFLEWCKRAKTVGLRVGEEQSE